MRLKNGNFEKKSLFALKNTRLTSAHFQKLFFWTLWLFLFPTDLKLNRPNEPQKAKNTKMSEVVKRQKIQNRPRDLKFFYRVIFIVDFEYNLRIDENYAI